MSKKFSFIFSILVFAILFSFIGCTDLLAPKAQTDINLNIDLSKIIKSSRNEGGSQGASSLGDNPTIKVAIYDAKDYDKATNSTENLTLITQAQASVGGDGIARVKLNDIPVGIYAIVFAELSFTDENSTQVVYAGNSDVFKVKASDNKVSLVLKKVNNSETSPDNTNTPYENYTLYKKTENGEDISNDNEASISTSSTGETIVTVKNTYNSDSVWTYFVKPNNNTRFVDDGNYKVSVELKTKSDATTVVGIAAARADYFFTVNDTWTLCEFETGYVKGSTGHQFTIGLGLSSEIQIKNLKIEKLSEIDTSEPSLVFDISKDAINSYLENNNRLETIIEVSKETKFENKLGYTITINAPLSHSESTSTATVQDVKLHLRSYATENTGANRVSFKITNNGSNDFETSVMADTASDKSTAWNNNATKISDNNDGNFSVDFPNYKANDELIVDLITSSTSTSQDNSTSFTLSNFKVEKAGDSPFSGKIFAIKTGETWTQGKSVEVTIPKNDNKEFDVGLFNGFNDEEGTPSDLDDVTRFLYTGNADITDDLSYSVNNTNPNEPKFIITDDSNEEKTVKISLNENYEVVIEEVTGATITSWTDLSNQIAAINGATPTTEFVITKDLVATDDTIYISSPVKITALDNVTISRGDNFTGNFFNVSSDGSLELAGSDNSTITLDGGNTDSNPIIVQSPLITVNGKLTLSNCTLQNNTNSASPNAFGGAVYVDGGTLNFSSGTIQNCIAGDAGAVYITNGGSFRMTGGTIQNCEASLSGGGVWMNKGSSFIMDGGEISNCKATGNEGGGVFITSNGNPCSFTMNGSATITGCSAEKDGGGVSYGSGTSDYYNFTMEGDASITNCSATGNGGGVYLYGNLVMNGGTISDNKASNGAGVYVRNDSSSFTMNGGTISDNNATGYGGGVYLLDSTSSFTMNGGVIGKEITEESETKQSWECAATEDKHSNSANGGGGGIYAVDGTVTIKDAKVSYNYVPDDDENGNNNGPSLSSGGGICMNKGTLTLENSEVSYNRGYLGAGVRCYAGGDSNEGTVTLKKAIIKGNAGKRYGWSNFGSGLTVKNFELICDSSSEPSIIEENFSADGGAVFLEHTTSTLENIIIRNNSFNDNGYKYGSEMLLWDSAVISIASNTVDISNNEPADRKGIFINNSTDKLKLSGDISLASPIYLYFENANSSPAVTVAGTLSNDTVATIKLVGSFATEGKLVLEAEEEVTLTDEIIAKFTLGNEDFVIDSNGMIASAINYAEGLTYDSTSKTLYISNEEGLITFRDIVNKSLTEPVTIKAASPNNTDITFDYTYSTGYDDSARTLNAKLTNDITLTNEWTPIGHSSIYSYAGTFDGDGHTISNLNINETTSSDSTGFIGYSGYNSTGGIIQNLVISGTMNVNSDAAGGFVGTSAYGCTITNCVNQINITNTSEADYTGTAGFVGLLDYDYEVSISNSINLGNITGTNNVAGFVGSYANSSSYNQSVYNIDKSINIGTIIVSKSAKTAAGFSAISASSSKSLTNLINMGTLGNNDVAGICYFSIGTTMTISNCINTGKSDITSGTYNAIIPLNKTTSNCYFDNSINPDYPYGGTGKTTAELCDLSQNDLSTDWTFDAGRYPLPDIGSSIPGGQEGDIWKAVIAAATPEDIGGGTGGGAIEPNATVSSWSVLKTTIESITGDYTKENPYIIAIENNMNTEDSSASTITVTSHIKLVATDNYTITRTTDFAAVNFFTVNQGASLTIGDSSSGILTLDGGGTSIETTKSLINVASGGTLILNQNSVLQNNICKTEFTTNGSAVYSSGGNIYVNGGIIQNNSNSHKNNYGGGIYLKNGTFTMTSGTFDGNSTYRQGGALWLQGSTVEISGGTFINNALTETDTPTENYYGSAIYIASLNESSTIAGIEVKNNENAGYGAIYIISTVTSFTNCNFISNSSYQRGGAIYIGTDSSNIEISNCTFEDNTTFSDSGEGGAIYCNDGTLTITDTQFSNNKQDTIYKGTNATITVDGVPITGSWNP